MISCSESDIDTEGNTEYYLYIYAHNAALPMSSPKVSLWQKMGGKRKKRLPPDLMEEVVVDILLRLPVKDLVRFKCVSKAWRAIISDPIFIRAQLGYSATKWERDPCFIISPQTLDFVDPEDEEQGRWPTAFCNHIRFYQWRQGNKAATFVHAKHYGCLFNELHFFAHCDGLVLVPTELRIYVFNPATRDAIKLPESRRNIVRLLGGRRRRRCSCVGLGLDPRTGKYKVVQAFYWSRDQSCMGMEVCTIADDKNNGMMWSWRDIRDDPPYPAHRCQTGLSINGYMFWRFAQPMQMDEQQPPRGLLHLCLAHEEFGITGLPDDLDPAVGRNFLLDVLRGQELCLAARTNETVMTIWTLPVLDEGLNLPWERRYNINVHGLFHPMALPPCSSGIILLQTKTIYRYDLATRELTKLCEMDNMRYQGLRGGWENLFAFEVKPYTESLVRIS